MNKTLSKPRITFLPALPEEGWASMDRYWFEMTRCAKQSTHGAYQYTRAIEQWLGEPPERSLADPSWRRSVKKYFWYPQVAKGLEAELFHVLDQSYAHLIPRLSKSAKVVASVFDIIPLEMSDQMTSAQVARFRSCVEQLKHADHVISISEETKLKLNRMLGIPLERVTVALPGMDLGAFKRKVAADHSLKARLDQLPPILFSVGTTLKRKNLESLLEIFAQMKPHFEQKKCCFVRAGQRFSPEVKRKFVELLGEDGFIELGPQYGEDLIAVYQAAKIFLFPSTLEGLTFTIPEAMAASCAVVTNCCTANPEAGGEAATYYEEGNSKQASECIVRLLEDRELYEMKVDMSVKRAEIYTWERHFEIIESVYDQVLGR